MAREECNYRGCDGYLTVEEYHEQDGTGKKARTMRCLNNPAHRFFIVDEVGILMRLTPKHRERRVK